MDTPFLDNLADFVGWGNAARQRKFNANEAQKTRDWETYMSNTSYQRAVQDMQAAGLNPALAYQNGGASTPSASSASGGIGQNNLGNMIMASAKLIDSLNNLNGKKENKLQDTISTAMTLIKFLK